MTRAWSSEARAFGAMAFGMKIGLGAALLLATGAATAHAQSGGAQSGDAQGGGGSDRIRLGVSAPITSVDPHFHNLSPNQALAAHIFDGLTDMDPRSHVIPGLASSWRQVDDKTWEFKLRDGVRFQNGEALAPEDIAFTLDRVPKVPNSPSSYAIYTQSVAGIDVVDPHTIRLRTHEIYPLLPIDLSQVAIISRKAGEGASTEDYNSGKAAIGTGPYRFVSYRPGDRVELERNDGYWGAKPAWAHVTLRIISNDAARIAALLSGDVDAIEAVPTSDLAKLRTDSRVKLAEVVGLRIVFLGLDQSRDGPTPFVFGPNGEKLDKNPLKDVRVRRALSLAINRQGIVERVMEGAAVPSGQLLPEGSFGYVPGLAPPPYDPNGAKKLLAEAGFPQGFRITLHGPNDRYVNDARIIQSIGQMWQRVGVQTAVEPQPWASYAARASKQEYSAFLFGWGSGTGEASNPLRAQLATWDPKRGMGTANRGRFSDPETDRLLDRALATSDDAARERLLQDATRRAMDQVGIIPLHIQKNIWAMRPGLATVPREDEETRAMDFRPAAQQ